MQIRVADETICIPVFIHGVRNNQLVERFHENLPKTVEEMLDRTKEFIRGKKACEELRDAPFEPQFGTTPKAIEKPQIHLPPLTKTPSKILATKNVAFTKPTLWKSGVKCTMGKYCEFSKEHGHITDEYFSLRRQIDSAIKMGRLAHHLDEMKKTTVMRK
jgi:hypothetical protein